MPKGRVKWFNAAKGYGFIIQDGGGKQVFVHITEVRCAGPQTLRENQVVTYEVATETDRGRASAVNLKV